MTRNRRVKTQIETLTFLLIFLVSSMFMVFPMNNSDSETNFNEVNNILPEPIESPRPSKISSASWWDGSWRYRRLINVTYPLGDVAFTNYTTSIIFNYTEHTEGTPDYPMNGDLSDIRIVQDGVLRKYYYKKDYPNTDFVTVWFDVDIGLSPDNIDTDNVFLYFNGSAQETVDPDYYMDTASNNTKDAMGWIRNGDFELDGETGQKLTTEVFGWTYTNAAPIDYDIDGAGEDNLNYMHELTESNNNQERTFGNWSFKWGDLGSWLETADDPDPPAEGHDFEGTLYTYPFIVPTLEGDVDLKLEVYRNFRVYNTKDSHPLGFYIRLCEDYSSDVDVHRNIDLEAKEQYEARDALGYTFVVDTLSPSDYYDTRNDPGPTPYSNDGEITGKFEIELDASDMGRLLFLEIGTYGKDDSGFQTAFTQVDDVSFNYELNTALNDDVQEVAGSATFITKDVDGRIVPNAEVTIMEEYGDPTTIGPYETSEEDGSVSFSNVAYGSYNVSVNYTIPYSGLEEVVYDSKIISTEFLIDGSGKVYELILNMSTIDFEIVDYGGYPLTYGYINVSYSKGGAALDILQLSNDGKATFRWLNRSFYYYQVYFNNTDYSLNPTPLNASYIWRDNYAKYPDGDKHQFHTLNINENNQEPPSSQYNVKKRIYMNDSMTMISDIKLINVSISIQNNEPLTNVSVYYIDSSNNTDTINHRIFFDESYSGATDDNINIDLMTVVNSMLSSENRLAYGLLIDVWGVNTSQCTGEIKINTTEALHVFNKTAISKLNIRVLGDGATISDAIVTIKSNSTILGNIVTTTLTSDKSRDSYAFSNNDLPFMFLRGYYYNFSVRWEGATIQDTFNVSGPDPNQWAPNNYVGWYNYSLLKYNFTLEFDIDMGAIDPSEYKLKFDNLISPEEVIWGNNVSVQVFFNKTEDNWLTDSAVTVPDSIQLKVQLGTEVLYTYNMDPIGSPGYYMKEFNSSILSAGLAGVFYKLVITGTKSPYTLQGDEITTLYVEGKGTVLSLHDYNNVSVEISEISQTFGESINLTVKYYNVSNSPLTDATLTYEWLGLDPIQFYEDPINIGYFTTTIDTSIAAVWGVRSIVVTATLENYTTQSILTSISITERETFLNGSNIVIFLSESVFALETETIEFNYTDVLSLTRISNPDEASYNWQKLDEFGDPIPGANKIGLLNETFDHRYILDLDTELMELGDYFVFLTFRKINYELRNAVLSLTIEERLTSVNESTGAFFINTGEIKNFTYFYTDNLTSTSITNLDTQSYTYNGTASGSGSLGYDTNKEIYYLIGFDTASLPNGTYTITVTFEKQNYTSQVVSSSLVITFIQTDYRSFLTLISQNPSNFLTDIYWRDNVTFTFNFTTQYQSNPQNSSHPTTVTLQFLDESLNSYGPSINLINYNTSMGIYSYTFNTSQLSFIGGESYYIAIYASKTTPTVWTPPEPLQILFKVQSVLTDLTIHNYTTGTIFPSYSLTEYWNQTFGITFYFGELISSSPITGATVTYSWAFGSGQVNPDGVKGPGYYSFFFDTGNVTEIGSYIISISAVKQNFSIGVPNPNLIITIINRPTLLNTNEDALYLRREFYVLDSLNFTFDFTDVLTNNRIWNADEKSFILNKRDNNGDIIPGSTILGFLHETADHQYILDLDTETLQVGEYSVVVTLSKDNHDFRIAIISLTIHVRVFSINFSIDTRINLVSGGTVQFQITLTDPNNNSVPVIGAYLTFTIKGIEYGTVTGGIFDNNDGSYTVNTLPIAEPFIAPETFIGTLIIEKANFTSETSDFTVVVQMTEIFSGMPMFYFILILAATIGIAGSLITYRVIQQARIPKFVKKIRKVKGSIKSKKAITESHLTKTKDQMMVKLYGDDWKELELSLEKSLGIVDLKLKPTPLKAKKSKKGGDRD